MITPLRLAAALFLCPLLASTASAQAYSVTTGTETFTSAHQMSGATKLYRAYTDGSTSAATSWKVALPFSFTFYGQQYEEVTVSSAGYLTFGNSGTVTSNNVIPSTSQPNNLIAPFWDGLSRRYNSGSTSYEDAHIYHHTGGTAPNRVFTVSWYRVGISATTNSYNNISMSARLYEGTNMIRFHYGPYSDWGSSYGSFSATVGIENADGTDGMYATGSCFTGCTPASFSTNRYYDFTPTQDLAVDSVSGPASAAAGDDIRIQRTIRNAGPTPTVSRTYGIYLSTDATITSSDTRIGTATVPALQPGAQDTTPLDLVLDFDGSSGNYYFGILLDGGDGNALNDSRAASTTSAITVPLAITAPAGLQDAVQGVLIPSDATNPYVFKAVGPGTTRSWSITGSLPAGIFLNAAAGKLEGVPSTPTAGQKFTVSVSNGSTTASREYTLVVRPRLTVTTASLPDAGQFSTYSVQLEASGGPNGRTWSIASGSLPAGLSLNASTGQISGVATTATTSTLKFQVTAGTVPFQQTAESVSLTLTVQPQLSVSLPQGAANPPDAIVGQAYSVQPTISGGTPGQRTISIASGTLPTGLSLNTTNGQVSGTVSTTGSWTFIYRVESGTQRVDKTWTIDAWDKLQITNSELPAAIEGASYRVDMQSSGGKAQKTWSMSPTSERGVSLSSAGVLSGTVGTPPATNPRSFTFTVTSGSQTATKTLDLLFIGRLSLPAATPPTAVAGQSYSFKVPVSGGLASKAFSVTSGALPPGLSLNASSGDITGTPTLAGSYAFTIKVESGTGSAAQETSRSYSLVVIDPLVITTSSLPNGEVGTPYSTFLGFSGGNGAWGWGVSVLPAGLRLDPQSGELSGTPTRFGTYSVDVSITRGEQTTRRTFTLVITGQLAITTTSLPESGRGMPYSFDLASDGAENVTWALSSGTLPTGLTLSAAGRLSGTPSQAASTSTFEVRATSGAQSVTRSFTLQVYDKLEISTASLPKGVTGNLYDTQLAATGGKGSYTWSWSGSTPSGLSLSSSTGRISGTTQQSGTFSVRATVTSGALTASRDLSFEIEPKLQITTNTLPEGVRGASYDATLSATGGKGSYTWSALSLPAGLNLSTSGTLSGTPTSAGTFSAVVRVTAGDQISETSLSLRVTEPLAVSTTQLPEPVRGAWYETRLEATGGGTQRSWTVANGSLPSGLTLSSNGTVSGVPSAAGTFSFIARVTSGPQSAVKSLTVTVREKLSITTSSLPDAVRGTPYQATVAATGGSGSIRYSITWGDLPAGLSLNPDTGVISGTPTQVGTGQFEVSATSGQQNAVRTLQIGVFDGLIVQTKSLPEGVRLVPYTVTLEAAGGTADKRWQLTGGQLPTGLSLSTSGTFSGAPRDAGTFSLQVRVTSGSLEATADLTLVVRQPLHVATTALEAGIVGQTYELTFEAMGGIEDDRRWSVKSGRLPPPLSLSEAGVLSGKPVLEGDYVFEVQVQSGDQSATAVLTLIIEQGELPLSVTTRRLAPALIGVPFAATLEAEGGEAPYVWSAATLPDGFTLTPEGELTGVGAAEGSHSIAFTVTDVAEHTARATLELLVVDPAHPTVLEQPLPGVFAGVPYATQLEVIGGEAPYTWTLASGALPEGIELSEIGWLTGTTEVEPGLFRFTVQVTDAAEAQASAELLLAVGRAGEVLIVTDSLPDAVEGERYEAELVAVGGAEPHVFSVESGLPPGVTLDRRGVLRGTPATKGSFTFTVRVDDASGLNSTRELTLTVAPQPPRRGQGGCGGCTGVDAGGAAALLALAALVRRRR